MSTATIQRQYDELIAENYDLDPLDLTNRTLDRALQQLLNEDYLGSELPAMKVLDLGMGTGLFYDKLNEFSDRKFFPYGLDISERMLDIAHSRLPGLQSAVDDAGNLNNHFREDLFGLACTHFITGFVPLRHLAPQIWDKLEPGGYWSFVGATSNAYPVLQAKASSRVLQMLFGNKSNQMANLITPADQSEVVSVFEENQFEICEVETYEPELEFRNFKEFMDFGYHGGWLTPFIEELGLQNAPPSLRMLLNLLVFPLIDHHKIVIGLVRKPLE